MNSQPQLFNSSGRINQGPQEPELAPCSLSGSSLNSSVENNVPRLFLAVGNGMSPDLGSSLSMSSMTSGKQMSQYITNILQYGLTTNQVEISLRLITRLKSHPKYFSSLISSLALVSRSLSHSRQVVNLLVLCIRDEELESLNLHLLRLVVDLIITWLSLLGDPVVGSLLVKECRQLVSEIGGEIKNKFVNGFFLVLTEVKSILISGRGGATARTEILDILVDMVKQEIDDTKVDKSSKDLKITDDCQYVSFEVDETKLNLDNSMVFQEYETSRNVDSTKPVLLKPEEIENGLVSNFVDHTVCNFNNFLNKDSKEVGDVVSEIKDNYKEDKNLNIVIIKENNESAEDMEFESVSEEDDELLPFNYIINKEIGIKDSCVEIIKEENISSTIKYINEDKITSKNTFPASTGNLTSPAILGHFTEHGKEDFYPVWDNSSIGRSKECQVCLPSKEVSKLHATVHHVDGGVYIKAQSVTNPLKVNNKLLPRGSKIELINGDIVRFGRKKLVWSSEDLQRSGVPGEDPDSTIYFDSPEVI